MYRALRRRSLQLVTNFWHKASTVDVPIGEIRHDTKECYSLEGHGGKPVEEWPIFRFYSEYLAGDETTARNAWIEWYLDQYSKYKDVPKSRGGMRDGSLDRYLKDCGTQLPNGDRDPAFLLRERISERVDLRLSLADRIAGEGYVVNSGRAVEGIRVNEGWVVVHEGHHRVAILAAMRRKIIPGMLVWERRLSGRRG